MTQDEAFDILCSGANAYLTGAAGSGKTYLLTRYINTLRKHNMSVGITASTGIAATHMGGLTIHSWSGIGIASSADEDDALLIASNKRARKRVSEARVLILDEISMFDADRLDLVDQVFRIIREDSRPFGGMQVVLSGDFFQLPPVTRFGETLSRFAYESSVWDKMNLKICYLTEQHRQGDDDFLRLLNSIRSGFVDESARALLLTRHGAEVSNGRLTKLYSHNANVDMENSRELARLSGREEVYRMESLGRKNFVEALKRGCLAPETLSLKKGAMVMFVKNNFEKGYVNGTLGEVLGTSRLGHPIVRTFQGMEIEAERQSWKIEEDGKTRAEITQVPLRLAWAITVHKSQGMTLDAAEIDLSRAFEPGMGYVALSRVRSLKGIRLLGLNNTALQVSAEVASFDSGLKKMSEEARRELCKMTSEERAETRKKFLGSVPEKSGKKEKTSWIKNIRKHHSAAYKRWTEEEDEALTREFQGGMGVVELARVHGRKEGGITMRLLKLELIEE